MEQLLQAWQAGAGGRLATVATEHLRGTGVYHSVQGSALGSSMQERTAVLTATGDADLSADRLDNAANGAARGQVEEEQGTLPEARSRSASEAKPPGSAPASASNLTAASPSDSGLVLEQGPEAAAKGWITVPQAVLPLVELYAQEQYLLGWWRGAAWVVLKPSAGPRAILRALWQAAWLEQHQTQHQHVSAREHHQPAAGRELRVEREEPGPGSTSATGHDRNSSGHDSSTVKSGSGGNDCGTVMGLLAASMAALHTSFEAFESEARSVGWDTSVVNLKAGRVRVATGCVGTEQQL